MSVVTSCLGTPGTENHTGIVKFMDVLLSSSRAATEKKKILEEEFGVAMNGELEREVLVMCNLRVNCSNKNSKTQCALYASAYSLGVFP